MESLDFKVLSPLLASENAKHHVVSYCSRLLAHLSSLKLANDDDTNRKSFDDTLTSLNQLVEFYNKDENIKFSNDHLSGNLNRLVARLYIMTFGLVALKSSALFDTTNKIITLAMGNDKKNTLFTSSGTAEHVKRQMLLLAVLEQLFETYGYELPSLSPIVIQYCYRSIKAIIGSSKTEFVRYAELSQLTSLLVKVLRNYGDSTLDSSIHGKILKSVKSLIKYCTDTKDVKNFNSIAGINLPVIPVANAFEILISLINCEKKYSTVGAKPHKDKNLFITQLNKEYNNYFLIGLISNHKQIRHSAAKSIAELLQKNLDNGNIPELSNVLAFYNAIYLSADDIKLRTSVFVSLIHFVSLNDVQNRMFLFDSFFPILDSFKELVCFPLLELKSSDDNKLFSQIYWFYEHFYLKNLGQFNKSIILQKLIDSEYLNNEPLLLKSPSYVQVLLKILEFLIKDLGLTMSSYQEQLKMILMKLITNRNFAVRVQAINTFVHFCTFFPNQLQSSLNHCLNEIQNTFRVFESANTSNTAVSVETSHTVIDFGKVHGYANCIAFLIKIIDKDYVSQDVVARTLTFASSQLKSVSALTSAALLGAGGTTIEQSITEIQISFNKRLISWTLLSGLMNYGKRFIKMHVSQLFIFWKNLLTHNYQATLTANTASDYKMVKARMDEVFRNLEIRNYALTCLLSFFNHEITPSIAKQASSLLSKCLTYVGSLESNISRLNQKEREDSYNEDKEKVLQLHKKRILQCYIKLSHYLRNDLNSSILIFALKNFSDPEIYTDQLVSSLGMVLKDKERDREKELRIHKAHLHNNKADSSIGEDLNNMDLFLVNDGLCYGVTSKLQNGYISELSVKYEGTGPIDGDIDDLKRPAGSIESKSTKSLSSSLDWVDKLDDRILRCPFTSSINNDYLLKIYDDRYSTSEEFSYGLNTSVIDLSIEMFSMIFPYLSPKIQQSLLEQLRGNLLRKKTEKLRMKALTINSAIALHGVLSVHHKNEMILDQGVRSTMLETLKIIDLKDPNTFYLNADSLALLSAQFETPQDRVDIHINDIINNDNPYARSADIVILSDLYRVNQSNFNSIIDVIMQLNVDPHPVVHYWSLYSLIQVMDAHLSANPSLCTQILENLEKFVYSNEYTIDKSSNLTANFSLFYDSGYLICRSLRSIIISLGPNIQAAKPEAKNILCNLLMNFLLVDNNSMIIQEVLKCLQNLMIFDKTMFPLNLYIKALNYLLKNTLKTTLANNNSPLPILTETNEIFGLTSSNGLLNTVLSCYAELVKVMPVDDVLDRDTKQFLWVCVNHDPYNVDLRFLIKFWFESSVDIKWFSILNTLYKVQRSKLYDDLYGYYRAILTKHDKQVVKVDLQDEEIESMARGNEDDNRPVDSDKDSEEPTSDKFKLFVLELMQMLLVSTRNHPKLYQQFQPRIQDLVKVSFGASTSSIMTMRLLGIAILGDIITIYGDAKDPLYDSVSLLEQQQAQITAALTPAFTSDSSTKLASEAINVCAKFVGSNIVPVEKCGRILRILVTSLEEFSSQGEPKIGEVPILTLRGKRRVKLSVLNAWAELKIYSNKENSSQIGALIDKYLEILVPMWILSLREYSHLKYEVDDQDWSDKEAGMSLFEACWINFVDVIGCIIEEKEQLIFSLLENEAGNFFFVLFAQCIEQLIKPVTVPNSFSLFATSSKRNLRVLSALKKLLHSKMTSEIIFHDKVFSETIDLFDRLIIVSEDEEKSVIIDIICGLFLNYFNLKTSKEEFTANIDKLFELLRVIMLAIISVLPFVAEDTDASGTKAYKKLSEVQMIIVKKSIGALVLMIDRFPIVMKVDLCACLLYIISLIYLNDVYRDVLMPLILGNVKIIVGSLVQNSETGLVEQFYRTISPKIAKNNEVSILTLMVLVTSVGDTVSFKNESVDVLVGSLTNSLLDRSTLPVAIQSIKSLILYSTKNHSVTGVKIMKKLIPLLVSLLVEKKEQIEDPRLIIEMLVLYSKQFKETDQLVSIFTIVITLICWYDSSLGEDVASGQFKHYLHTKLMNLLNLNSESFKIVVNDVLSADQKKKTEDLVKFDLDSFNSQFDRVDIPKEAHIELKTFGD